MIIKASDALRKAVFKVPQDWPRFVSPPGAFPQAQEDLSHLLIIMPNWLKEMLHNGQYLVIDRQEWMDLPYEIKIHMEATTP